MCGIVGAVAERNITAILIEGLKRLEYRGYDSAGLAVINSQNHLQRLRTIGKVVNLETALEANPFSGNCGIAHTRWATHGKPTETNAHPHQSGSDIAVVHNGIIENHDVLRAELIGAGYTFATETDTEVVAHLIHRAMAQGAGLLEAVKSIVPRLEGAYAIVAMSSHEPGHLVAVRHGNPIVVGLGFGEHYLASDSLALLPVTQRFVYLAEGDIVDLHRTHFEIYDKQGQPVTRAVKTLDMSAEGVSRGKYRHYMQKEIFEQAAAINATLEGRLGRHQVLQEMFGAEAGVIFDKVQHVQIVACGTSYHAGMVARYWLESYAGVSCHVEVASEFRYRGPILEPDSLVGVISQSGETADTLAAIRLANEMGTPTFSIVNVPGSSIMRETTFSYPTKAGPEIGVASTKAFTSQVTVLSLLALDAARIRNRLNPEESAEHIQSLARLPHYMEKVLAHANEYVEFGASLKDKRTILFLGRGPMYPISLEGALKLKEITYRHAEGYAAGELKHGPLALIEPGILTVFGATDPEVREKLASNIKEVQARGGHALVITTDDDVSLDTVADTLIKVPRSLSPTLNALISIIPLQMLAYHMAKALGCEIDQPRNLAKSVTVE